MTFFVRISSFHMFCIISIYDSCRTITGEGRDAMLNLIMTNCPWDRLAWAEKMLKTDGYSRLMEV